MVREARRRQPRVEGPMSTGEHEFGGTTAIVGKVKQPTQLAALIADTNWPILNGINILETYEKSKNQNDKSRTFTVAIQCMSAASAWTLA